jgi:hypothetical protein
MSGRCRPPSTSQIQTQLSRLREFLVQMFQGAQQHAFGRIDLDHHIGNKTQHLLLLDDLLLKCLHCSPGAEQQRLLTSCEQLLFDLERRRVAFAEQRQRR